jgi:ubiquitin C-terminal hydrolase
MPQLVRDLRAGGFSYLLTFSFPPFPSVLTSHSYSHPLTLSQAKHSSTNAVAPYDSNEITLDKCLALYTTLERLGPDDPWYCNRCKEHRQATKKFDLWYVFGSFT